MLWPIRACVFSISKSSCSLDALLTSKSQSGTPTPRQLMEYLGKFVITVNSFDVLITFCLAARVELKSSYVD